MHELPTAEKIGIAIAVLTVMAASPFIQEQATKDVERTNETYWLERGYDPLPQPAEDEQKRDDR